jgi:hypothetical protein
LKLLLRVADLLATQLTGTPRVERRFAGQSIVDPR